MPQVTTDPSARIAANAKCVTCICCTSLSWRCTWELSPSASAKPQVTTDLSARIAANAWYVARTCCTFLSWCCTWELSPPASAMPQVTTDPSARIAANAWFVAWTCCTFLSWCCTWELSPPQAGSLHVMILLPPQHHNVKACWVAANFTSCAMAIRWSFSWIQTAATDSVGSVRKRPSAVNRRTWRHVQKTSRRLSPQVPKLWRIATLTNSVKIH